MPGAYAIGGKCQSKWRGVKSHKRHALPVRRHLINRVVKRGECIELVCEGTVWRPKPRFDARAARSFIDCPGARQLGRINPLDDMVGEGSLDLHFGLRQGKNLPAERAKPFGRSIKADNWQ